MTLNDMTLEEAEKIWKRGPGPFSDDPLYTLACGYIKGHRDASASKDAQIRELVYEYIIHVLAGDVLRLEDRIRTLEKSSEGSNDNA